MSRLSTDHDLPAQPRNRPVFTLKKNRRRPPHPEQVHEELRKKAARTSEGLCAAPYGWLLRLYGFDNERTYRNLPPGTSYEEAVRIRDHELGSGWYEKCWLEQKKFVATTNTTNTKNKKTEP